MNDILNDLIHLNLYECEEVLIAVQERIKILKARKEKELAKPKDAVHEDDF